MVERLVVFVLGFVGGATLVVLLDAEKARHAR